MVEERQDKTETMPALLGGWTSDVPRLIALWLRYGMLVQTVVCCLIGALRGI